MKNSLGTQLRTLIELLDGAVGRAYQDAGLDYRPRYTPVMRVLLACEPCSIGEIAEAARITQPAATQTVGLMLKQGLLVMESASDDARRRMIRLSPAGRALVPALEVCWRATAGAAASLDAELPMPLLQLVNHALAALEEKPFERRIAEARSRNEAENPIATTP